MAKVRIFSYLLLFSLIKNDYPRFYTHVFNKYNVFAYQICLVFNITKHIYLTIEEMTFVKPLRGVSLLFFTLISYFFSLCILWMIVRLASLIFDVSIEFRYTCVVL